MDAVLVVNFEDILNPFSSVSVDDFEQLNASWIGILWTWRINWAYLLKVTIQVFSLYFLCGDLQIITNAKLRKIIIKAQTTGSPGPLIGKYVKITIIDELNTLIKEKMSSSRI